MLSCAAPTRKRLGISEKTVIYKPKVSFLNKLFKNAASSTYETLVDKLSADNIRLV